MPSNFTNRRKKGNFSSNHAKRGSNSASYSSEIARNTNAYNAIKEGTTMAAKDTGDVTGKFSISGMIVAAVGLIICTLVGVVWGNLSGDISDLKKDQKSTTQAIYDTKLEIVKSISAVEKQLVQTNQKLESFVEEMRKRRN